MHLFNTGWNEQTDEKILEVRLAGHALLNTPLLNKGTAFSWEERHEFGLLGLLPPHVATLEEQVARAYANYQRQQTDLQRYMFLSDLQNLNETLFYQLVQQHLSDMMPIIYTPTVGVASQSYSHIYRQSRGLYISYPQQAQMDNILENVLLPDVRVIIVTDGERILGLGDLGVGGMSILIGKLALYTLCAGIHPATTLPIVLDVGTNNQTLLNDPYYLGWRQKRLRGQEYDDFIEAFIQSVQHRFPNVLFHWEDFSNQHAYRLLRRYQDQLCTFNDDIQGTGAVTLAGLLGAMEIIDSKLSEQRIVMFGAGSAARGITDQIVVAMMQEGCSEAEARSKIWLIDSRGFVHTGRKDLDSFKQGYAQPQEYLDTWQLPHSDSISLADVVRQIHPTILIGTAAQPGAFTEGLVREMAQHVERPIIFPLSNPTSKSEAVPADLIAWTEGRALVATGSPFPPVTYGGRKTAIGQCNNSFIFPGVGLGVIATNARRVTDTMFAVAARALSELSPACHKQSRSLYPALEDVREVSRRVAVAVGAEAQRLGLAEKTTPAELERRVQANMWAPHYLRLKRAIDEDV